MHEVKVCGNNGVRGSKNMQNLMICNLAVNLHCPNRPSAHLPIVVFTGLAG
jgi:hypothetical protein